MTNETTPSTITKRNLSVLSAAFTDETRPNLCAVAFEQSGLVIATNGHMLLAHLPAGIIPAESGGTVLISRDDATTLRKSLGAKGEATRDGACFDAGAAKLAFEPVAAEFPDWRKVLPTHESRTVRLDARYLKLACEAAIASGAEFVDLTGSDKEGLAAVKLVATAKDGAQLLAIVMPARP